MTEPAFASGVLPGEFRIGQIFGRSFSMLSRDFLPFVGLTALATSPNLLLAVIGGPHAHPGLTLLTVLLALILGNLAQAFVLYGAFQHMMGNSVQAGQSLSVALGRFFPIIGASICIAFGGMFGFLLLVVPGFMWLMMWWVTIPACVVEGLGPIESMRRSSQLTLGHRWPIFGLFVLLVVANLVVSFILGAILGAAGLVRILPIVTWAWGAIYTAFYAIVAVTAYHDLRVLKEGVDTHQIAAVFS